MLLNWERLEGRGGHDVGRQLLEKLYRQQCGHALPEIRLTEQGKPYFPENSLHFSISHTKNHAFCCLSSRNIGIDAEECDRDIDLRLGDRILSPAEKARLDTAADKQAALLRLWVLKESYAKLTGRGWGNYLSDTDFDPSDSRIRIIDGCYVAVLEE